MSNKFKKLLCGVLSAAMLVTSSSLIAFADDDLGGAADADRNEEEAQEEVLATPAPTAEATAAPAGYDYENDAYYQRALGLCQALGIITGYEDGSVQPNSVVSRAEMATIVLRALNAQATAAYNNAFSDVDSSHWAAATIQTAANQNIINGFEDGTFQPDGDVTTIQVWKMLVCAANFGYEAEINGGWPSGYASVANTRMELNNGVASGDMNDGAERGNVIKMVYNALMAPFNQPSGTQGGMILYDSQYTWAKVKFNVFEGRGILTATSTTSMSSEYKPQDGNLYIDDQLYATDLTGIDAYVGSTVTYYYSEDSMGSRKVLSVAPDNVKSESVEIDVSDIESFTGFADGRGKISLLSSSKTYDVSDATIIYNGSEITNAAFQMAKAADRNNTRFPADMTYDDFLVPREGSLKLINNDNDSAYDIVYIESYQTMVIVSANDRRVSAETNEYTLSGSVGENITTTIDVDADANPDKTVKITRDGIEANPRNLRADDVVAVKRSIDDMSVEFICETNSITGSISSVSTDSMGNAVATINGSDYVVAAVAYDDCAAGVEGTFYLDVFDRVGRIEAGNNGGLSGSEKYGWIMNAYLDDSGSEMFVKLYTSDNTEETYKLANTVSFWGTDDSSAKSMSGAEAFEEITNNGTLDNDAFLTTAGSNLKGTPVRLVKYRTNSNDEINLLYTAVAGSTSSDNTNMLVMSDTVEYNYTCRGSIAAGKYSLTSPMTLIQVPANVSDMKDAANYNITTTEAGSFLNSSKGVNRYALFGQFTDGTVPQVVVEFLTSTASSAPTFAAYDNADESGHPLVIVDSIGTGIDEDQNTVYIIKGFTSGGEVSYTTRSNTSLYQLNGGSYMENSTHIWDAISNSDSIGNYLKKGDVLAVHNNGEMFVRIASIDEIIKYAKTGEVSKAGDNPYQIIGAMAGSNTREMFLIGHILDAQSGTNSSLTVGDDSGSGTVLLSAGQYMDLIMIDEDGNVTYEGEGTNVAELIDYEGKNDGTIGEGDLALVYEAPKGRSNAVIVFRFGE